MNDDLHVVPLPDGEVRVFPPASAEGDASRMYVMDVFGVTLQVRLVASEEEGDKLRNVYVHVRNEDRDSNRLHAEVNDTGVNIYGED